MVESLKPCPFCNARMERKIDAMKLPYWHHASPTDNCPAGGLWFHETDADAIAAWNRRPASEPVGVETVGIKALVWKDMSYKGVEEWLAHHPFGNFTVQEGDYTLPFVGKPVIHGPSNFATADEAKAALEDDYKKRIRSALVSAVPAVAAEPAAWQARESWWHDEDESWSHWEDDWEDWPLDKPRLEREDGICRQFRPLYAVPASAVSERERRLETLLTEARDKGLMYWEPNTLRGDERKADMLARIDAALSETP